MIRFRLRYLATDIQLPEGTYVVGRGSSCNLALDDGLVSRQHARFTVIRDGVQLEDLSSRNGTLVNGMRLNGSKELKDGDLILIGSQELKFLEAKTTSRPEDRKRFHTLSGTTLELGGPSDESETTQVSGFVVLAGIANKVLALGRFEEAERLLEKHLMVLLRRAKAGEAPDPKSQRRATYYALRLADGLDKSEWIDWVFELHTALKEVPSGEVVDTLHRIIRKVRYRNAAVIRDCVSAIAERRKSLSPADRFLHQRLSGLLGVVSG